MQQRSILIIAFALLMICPVLKARALPFELVTPGNKVSIAYSAKGKKLDSITAHLLAADIQRVTGYLPKVVTSLQQAKGNVILIGVAGSEFLANIRNSYDHGLTGTWERYSIRSLERPTANIRKAVVIAGSDERGMAYGVFSISEKIGVSPWYWWADVRPKTRSQLIIDVDAKTSAEPSVRFRGIFINDEDWGLQPWAAKTYEPETGDIGPKTYAQIFELLLRLKANLIWPAMHPSTKAFYSYPGNKQVAADYDMVVGSSHAEPMLRNNVSEWNERTMGRFNYVTNRDAVHAYWEDRVKESQENEVIFSMGMRGVHDSGMEGVKSSKEAIPLLEKIFDDQRQLIQKYTGRDASTVPQAFTIYKEVLEVYEAGLKVPDDVTLVWPDDNYGYIQRLSNERENKRTGGSGVYYHASYWGRPHDYLWLSTTHPALIREEMVKAYNMNARKIWVLNVGDIKPCEYDLQLFADMAYNVKPFQQSEYSYSHLQGWANSMFGERNGPSIAKVLWKHYDLAFERRPEFMGWSQTEPTTKTRLTAYDHFAYGDQAQHRMDAYDELENKVKMIGKSISANMRDAWFQLVEYPVTCASLMNKKFLYHDKAVLYAQQGRASAEGYQKLSGQAYEAIVTQTDRYNNDIAGGKWKYMMSMAPRELPVFEATSSNVERTEPGYAWSAIPEGQVELSDTSSLPLFDRWNKQRYFVDVFLGKEGDAKLTVIPSAPWIKVSTSNVELNSSKNNDEQRLWVTIDWASAPRTSLHGSIMIKGGGSSKTIDVVANNLPIAALKGFKGIVASGDHAAFEATSYTSINNTSRSQWKVINGLGSAGKALEALPIGNVPTFDATDTSALRQRAAVRYEVFTLAPAEAAIQIFTLPTFPLNNDHEMRYAVSIDGGPMTVLNFKTVGRSEEWKQNVLSNSASRSVKAHLSAGKHTIAIYQVDPGVILDRIFIDLGKALPFYGTVSLNRAGTW